MVAPAVRHSLGMLRYVIAICLAFMALYGAVLLGDWIGAVVIGVFAWLIWPKTALAREKIAPPTVVAPCVGQHPPIRTEEHMANAEADQPHQAGRSPKPTLISARTRLVATAIAFGVLGSILLAMIVGMFFVTADEDQPKTPDHEAYIADVKPHLAISGWTDLQLLEWGGRVCSDLNGSNGDIKALMPMMVQAWVDAGFTEDQLSQTRNDSVFIADAAIRHLCPEWIGTLNDE